MYNTLKSDNSELLDLADTYGIEHDGSLNLDTLEQILTDENTVSGFNAYINSEEALSERFDQLLSEEYPDFPTDDEPALNEFFSNWSDGLRDDYQIHELQYHEYCYVGKYS